MNLALILFICGTVPVLFAAIQPWVWSFYAAVVFAGFGFQLWRKPGFGGYKPGCVFYFTVGIFLVWTLIQTLPFPVWLAGPVDSFQFDLRAQAAEITGIRPDRHHISFLPLQSFSWWLFLLSLLLYFFLLKRLLLEKRKFKILVVLLIAVGFLEAVYGLVQVFFPSTGVLWVDHTAHSGARGTYINRNHFAGFMEMIWPLGLGWLMYMGKVPVEKYKNLVRPPDAWEIFFKQVTFSLIVVLMLLSLVFSGSRAGITSAFFGLVVFSWFSRLMKKKQSRRFLFFAGTIMVLFLIYGTRIGFEGILERFLRLSKDASRLDVWQDSLVLVAEKPLGIGLANFLDVFKSFNTLYHSDRIYFAYTHNDYLQLLVETGWPGFLALAGGFFYFIYGTVRRIYKEKQRLGNFHFFMGIGALSGLISIGFHSLFDFNLQVPANCFYFVTLITIVYVCFWETPRY